MPFVDKAFFKEAVPFLCKTQKPLGLTVALYAKVNQFTFPTSFQERGGPELGAP